MQRIKQVTIDESTTLYYNTHENGQKLAAAYYTDMVSKSPIMCDRYAATTWANTNGKAYTTGDAVVITDNRFTDATATKAILKNAPITVMYVLATPIETTIAVDTLRSYNPNTTVFNTSGADMLVDCIRDVNENAFEIVLNQSKVYPTETTITVADGGEYRYENAITALTVNYPAGTFECWIKFLTGSTFTLTLPTGTTYIGNIPDFAASTWYEVSIKDGVAIFGEVGTGE